MNKFVVALMEPEYHWSNSGILGYNKVVQGVFATLADAERFYRDCVERRERLDPGAFECAEDRYTIFDGDGRNRTPYWPTMPCDDRKPLPDAAALGGCISPQEHYEFELAEGYIPF